MSVIKDLAIALGLDVGDTPEKLADVDAKAEKTARTMGDRLGSAAKTAATGLGVLAAAGTATAVGLFKLVEGSAASAAAVDDLAKRTGRSARDLQRVGFTFEQAGGSAELLLEAFKSLDVQLEMVARTGTGPAAEAMKALGISIDDLRGKDAEEQLARIADGIAAIEDPGKRTAAAVGLLGGAGQRLVPLLADGGDAIRAMGDEAERLGLVLSDDAIAAGAELDDTLQALQGQIAAVARDVGLALAPAVTELARDLSAWVAENRDLIESGLSEFVDELVPKIVDVARVTLDVVSAMADVIDSAGGVESSLMLIAGGYGAIKVAALGIPGAMVVAGAAIAYFSAEAIGELNGVNAELDKIEQRRRDLKPQQKQAGKIQTATNLLDAKEAELAQLSEREFERQVAEGKAAIQATASLSGEGQRGAGKAAEGLALSGRFEATVRERRERGIAGAAMIDAAGQRDRAFAAANRAFEAQQRARKARGGGAPKAKPDEAAKPATDAFDPILSEILGADVSAVTSRKAIADTTLRPQTLVNTVNNAFAFDVKIAIDGARAPDETANAVGAAIRRYFDDQLATTARELETRIVR